MPMPINPARKLFPGLLDNRTPVKKATRNGTYHGRKKVSKQLRMAIIKIFRINISLYFFILFKHIAS